MDKKLTCYLCNKIIPPNEISQFGAPKKYCSECVKEAQRIKDLEAKRIKRGKKRKLTNIEKFRIAEIIDRWYFDWKNRITKQEVPHSLGFAKEELKQRMEELEL